MDDSLHEEIVQSTKGNIYPEETNVISFKSTFWEYLCLIIQLAVVTHAIHGISSIAAQYTMTIKNPKLLSLCYCKKRVNIFNNI